jgi:endonuclease/exonuclease/phosphatase family metal-dependent hydrolase
MSRSPLRRGLALTVAAASILAVLPATASARPNDLKVMVRNVYLGGDIVKLATAQNKEEFERNASEIFRIVRSNDFPTRAKALAAEVRTRRPDLIAIQEAATWRTGPKDDPAPAADLVYDSISALQRELAALGLTYRVASRRDWLDVEGPTTEQDVRLVQGDVILVRVGSKVKINRSFRGGFDEHLDVPTQAGLAQSLRGWVGVDGTLARRRFRLVSTHLEAYSPDIADNQMKQLLREPLASRRRQSILVGDFNSAPSGNANDRGTSRDASAYYSAIDAGFRNPLPQRATCCFAEDLRSTAEPLETWIDHIVVRPRIRALRSGVVGRSQVGGLYPSDHAGIWATLRLTRR